MLAKIIVEPLHHKIVGVKLIAEAKDEMDFIDNLGGHTFPLMYNCSGWTWMELTDTRLLEDRIQRLKEEIGYLEREKERE